MLIEKRGYGKKSETPYSYYVVPASELDSKKLNPYTRFINAGISSVSGESITPQERLLVAIQADGSFDTTTKNLSGELRRNGSISGTVPCSFSFKKKRKSERLSKLSSEAGWKLVSRGSDKRGRECWTLYVPVGFPLDKRLHSIKPLDEVSHEWAVEFIDELSYWDGHRVENKSSRITWGSVVKENADYVQAVCALAGYRTHYREWVDNRKDTFNNYHRVQIHRKLSRTGGQKVKRIDYGSSEMYAISVPSTFLLTRLDGSVTVTGNCIHGYYIGYKFQRMMERLSEEEREAYREKAMNLFKELYANELKYTESIYDEVLDTRPGITDEVKKFLRYNGNKALLNLGFEPMFSAKETEVLPSIMTSLTPNSNENHDFFSDKGSSYKRSTVEETSDDDWD